MASPAAHFVFLGHRPQLPVIALHLTHAGCWASKGRTSSWGTSEALGLGGFPGCSELLVPRVLAASALLSLSFPIVYLCPVWLVLFEFSLVQFFHREAVVPFLSPLPTSCRGLLRPHLLDLSAHRPNHSECTVACASRIYRASPWCAGSSLSVGCWLLPGFSLWASLLVLRLSAWSRPMATAPAGAAYLGTGGRASSQPRCTRLGGSVQPSHRGSAPFRPGSCASLFLGCGLVKGTNTLTISFPRSPRVILCGMFLPSCWRVPGKQSAICSGSVCPPFDTTATAPGPPGPCRVSAHPHSQETSALDTRRVGAPSATSAPAGPSARPWSL